jgi:glycosyltransferase involved in cell wall biosynthesis
MKVILNGKFLSQKTTGVQRYAREIIGELDNICGGLDIEIAVPKDAVAPKYKNIKVVQVGKFKGTLWEQISFCRYVKKNKAVSVNLCNAAPLSGRKIVAIHDLKIKAHPEYFSKKFLIWYNFLFKNITKKAEKLITVSQFSKDELIKYYGVDDKNVTVIYDAWQHYLSVSESDEALKKYEVEAGGYYFAMSSLEPNKNIDWIINVAKNNPDEKFLIAGGINNKVFAQTHTTTPDNVKFIGYAEDADAKSLLKNCKGFLYPTFYEGFGIPPLEALCVGCKRVIVSDTPIMHEIFGDAVIYIQPNKYDYDLAELGKDFNLSEEQSQTILSKYSWLGSAKKLLEMINKL